MTRSFVYLQRKNKEVLVAEAASLKRIGIPDQLMKQSHQIN